MTSYLCTPLPPDTGTGQGSRGLPAVLPPVVPRPSPALQSGRSGGSFRLRREGTDPASRGLTRPGQQGGRWGDAA
jgi:hypothetical protein